MFFQAPCRFGIFCATASLGSQAVSHDRQPQTNADRFFAILPLASPAKRSCRIRILLVRHAESENNVSVLKLVQAYRRGEVLHSLDGSALPKSRSSLETAIHERNIPDCLLTDKGFEQARMLGAYAQSETFKQFYMVPGSSIYMYTSPMQRTLLTAKSLADGLGVTPQCLPSIFEKGGDKEMEYGKVCLTAAEIRKEYGFLTDLLPEHGGWYLGGEEDQLAFENRICNACQTLTQKALEAAEAGRDANIVVVTHGIAIRQFLVQLLLAGQDPMASAGPQAQFMGIHALPSGVNTGVTVLEYRCNIDESSLMLGLCMLNSAEHLGDRVGLRSSFL